MEELLNNLPLPYESINATIYPNDLAIIIRVTLYPNTTYNTDNVSTVHTAITESSSIAGCHISTDSVYTSVYISSG